MSLHPNYRLALAAALAAALAGCESWTNIGPEPDNFIGRGTAETPLTDPSLKAVIPHVAGDEPGGGVPLPVTSSPATASAPAAAIPESLSVQDAILTGLEHNVNLRIQRLNVPISRTSQESARAVFDPSVSYSLEGGRSGDRTSRLLRVGTTGTFTSVTNYTTVDSISGSATVTEFLPTGTTIQAGITTSNNFYSESALTQSGNLTVTQSLLRGAGLDVNLATLREAEIATRVTQYQLRNTAETLVASIEAAYWDLAFAERQVVIVQNSLDLAQKQLDDTTARVNVQRLSPSELPAAQAQVATQREALINANSTLESARLNFLQSLTPSDRQFWTRSVNLTTLPFIPQGDMDPVDSHVEVAMRFRPDLNQALLQIQRGDLEIVRTKNGLLPKLDLFVNLTKAGSSGVYIDSLGKAFNGPNYQASLGVKGDWEPINRSAEASYRSAQLSREQLQSTLDNQRQLAQLNVRDQYIEVIRTRRQIDATRATRAAQQATYDVQKGKLDAGNGTTLDLAIAQNALLNSQLSEVQAVTNHLKALVTLYQQEGTLLLRRGIQAPGAEPVTGPVWR
jgi:outer membrane protein